MKAWLLVVLLALVAAPSVQADDPAPFTCLPDVVDYCVSTCLHPFINYCVPPRPRCYPVYILLDPQGPGAEPVVYWDCLAVYEQFVWQVLP